MKTVWEQRASTILFNLISSLETPGLFLIPSNVCPVVAATLLKAGRGFELVDIDPQTHCLDERLLLSKLETNRRRYAGILFVHTYGSPRSFEPAFRAVKECAPHLLVVDDRCLCIPGFDDLEQTAADVLLYSTGYSKYAELGYGGYAFMRQGLRYRRTGRAFDAAAHETLVGAMREAQETGQAFLYLDSNWLDCTPPTGSFESYRSEVLARCDSVRTHKELLNRIYQESIPPEVQMGSGLHDWRFNILVPQKEKLLRSIFDAGLFASSHYPSLVGVFGTGEGKQAERLHSRVVNLFNNDRFSAVQAERVSVLVANHLKRYGAFSC